MTVADIQANAIPVTCESEGSRLSGNLYVPPDHTPGTRVPGILVTGSWTTVKEQMAPFAAHWVQLQASMFTARRVARDARVTRGKKPLQKRRSILVTHRSLDEHAMR
jgi:hypothetical protein